MLDDAGDGGEAHERRSSDGVWHARAHTTVLQLILSPSPFLSYQSHMHGFRLDLVLNGSSHVFVS